MAIRQHTAKAMEHEWRRLVGQSRVVSARRQIAYTQSKTQRWTRRSAPPTARHNRDIRQFAAAFYDAVLFALGYVRVWSDATAIGYGRAGSGDKLAIKLSAREVVAPGPGFHVAFSAPSREAVARFHATALKHGGQDNGAPGLRPEYGENYYAAFVIDPDGYRVEAVMDRGT